MVSQRETGKIFLSRKENSGRLTCKSNIICSSLLVSVRAATSPTNSVVSKCLGMGSLLQSFLIGKERLKPMSGSVACLVDTCGQTSSAEL